MQLTNSADMLNLTLYDMLFAPKYRILRYILLSIVLFLFAYFEMSQRFPYVEELMPFALLTANAFFCNMIYSIIILGRLSHLLLKRHYIFFWLLFFTLTFVIIYFQYFSIEITILKYFDITFREVNLASPEALAFLLGASVQSLIFSVCLFILRINKYWMIENEQRLRIEASSLRIEAELMKEQVSPALLCSTLHRGGVLAQTAPKETSDMLMQFCKLLRYQLYDCSQEKVLLDSEIHFLNRYLSILEYNEGCSGFNISVSGQTTCILIPPLLLVPFLQSEMTLRKKSNIDIKILVRDNYLTFELLLACATDNTESIKELSDEAGIRRRLNQFYPQRHSLTVEPYHALLTIQL